MAEKERRIFNDRYELEARLARGGMANVFLARDLQLDRPVALKVLFPEFATDPTFVQRFRREAQAAANLNHPNIVSIYDWGEERGTYFIVMEYIEGQSLAQLIHNQYEFSFQQSVHIIREVASALQFAHENDVIHRDVKPGNILISKSGQVKVTDFGIAQAISAKENLTQTGTVMGTATYFSPEQARGLPIDPRSDVYSLGVVLYEMLTGTPPFSGDNPVSVAYKHVQETPEAPTQRNPEISPELEAVVLMAMAKEADARYESAEAFGNDLENIKRGLPVAASAFGATSAMSSISDTTMVASTSDHTRATQAYEGTMAMPRTPSPTPARPAPPRRSGTFIGVMVAMILLLIGGVFLFAKNLGVLDGEEKVTLTDMVNLTQAEASQKLEDLGLRVNINPVVNDSVEEGRVFDQRPRAGTKVAKGSLVELRVSSGKTPVNIPLVEGLTEEDARDALERANLVADIQPEPSDDVPEGEVISQEPKAGESLAPGSSVTLKVSSGPADVTVPNVTGFTTPKASNALGKEGLEVTPKEEASDTVPAGQVIRTDPPAGAQISKGETVTLIVSTGPSTVAVPNVVGLTTAQATSRLESAGFVVFPQTKTVLSPADDGRVVEQSPTANTTAAKGSRVTITTGVLGVPTSTSTSTTTTSSLP